MGTLAVHPEGCCAWQFYMAKSRSLAAAACAIYTLLESACQCWGIIKSSPVAARRSTPGCRIRTFTRTVLKRAIDVAAANVATELAKRTRARNDRRDSARDVTRIRIQW